MQYLTFTTLGTILHWKIAELLTFKYDVKNVANKQMNDKQMTNEVIPMLNRCGPFLFYICTLDISKLQYQDIWIQYCLWNLPHTIRLKKQQF